MFSIIIPTYNNFHYLNLTINSIKKNSKENNYEIILHINDGSDGTLNYAKKNNLLFTHSINNIGLCSSINLAANLANYDYILYSHDDMYFCPHWDNILQNEVDLLKNNLFYLSGTMVEVNSAHVSCNFGTNVNNFNEKKFLENYKKIPFYDHQGSHFAPHLVHKNLWKKVGGFSEEFNPGIGSDPDFNMKLWNEGVRIFKGINKLRIYHFGSVTTRKKPDLRRNNGERTFIKKWGISTKFFKKHYLRSKTIYYGELKDPVKNFSYFFDFIICKIKLLIIKLLNQ